MARIAVLICVLLLALGVMAGPAAAQPPPHDHLLTVPGTGEQVQIGPPRCELGETLDQSFLQVHGNVHEGAPVSVAGLTIIPDLC